VGHSPDGSLFHCCHGRLVPLHLHCTNRAPICLGRSLMTGVLALWNLPPVSVTLGDLEAERLVPVCGRVPSWFSWVRIDIGLWCLPCPGDLVGLGVLLFSRKEPWALSLLCHLWFRMLPITLLQRPDANAASVGLCRDRAADWIYGWNFGDASVGLVLFRSSSLPLASALAYSGGRHLLGHALESTTCSK
jgi:hypothetical protein